MALEPIRRNSYAQPDRSEVQERVAAAVESNPEVFIERYNSDPRSFGGRYVCSDLFKETFPEYSASRESRDRFNAPVHNSAAVLASEQFRRVLRDDSDQARNRAVFLTGIPGAGKTTFVLASGQLAPDTRVVFEGQLAKPETTIPKIQEAIDAGLKPTIVVVHAPAERALHNTLQRFQREGRGASLHVMAQIQSELPSGLQAVHEHFGNAVDLIVIDRRDTITTELRGWNHLPEIASEGSYDTIKQRLTNALEQHRDAGTIDDAGYNQALGRALPQLARSVDSERRDSVERSGNALPQGLLTDPTQAKVELHGSLRFWQEQTPEHSIKHAAGTLLSPGLVSSKRDLSAQRSVSRGTGDDAGHLIGHQFGGPEIPANLSLQHYAQNQGGGTYWQLEKQWADQLRKGIGVSVHVREMTRAGEDRPYHRHVEWVETHPNGRTERGSLDFMNAESYKTRAARGEATPTFETPAKVIDLRAHLVQREQSQPGASWKEGAQPPTSPELASGESNQNEIDAPPLSTTEHATPFHEVPMPDFENAPQPYYPPTAAVPTHKTDAELRRDAANAMPGEDSIFRNDKEEQRNDPHYKQWIKDEGVNALPSGSYIATPRIQQSEAVKLIATARGEEEARAFVAQVEKEGSADIDLGDGLRIHAISAALAEQETAGSGEEYSLADAEGKFGNLFQFGFSNHSIEAATALAQRAGTTPPEILRQPDTKPWIYEAHGKALGEPEQDQDEAQIAPALSADLAAAAQQLRKTNEQLTQEAQNEADQDNEKDLGERSNESIAVRLTEEQTKLLLSAEYPNDGRTQTTALAAIYSGEDQVNIMEESVQLDYSEDQQTFFAILERGEKPALDAKLTQLQAERMRDNADREKAQDPRQRERSRERQHER